LVSEMRPRALVQLVQVVKGQASPERGGNYHLWGPVLRAMCVEATLDPVEIGVLSDIVPDLETLLETNGTRPPPLSPQATQNRLIDTIVQLFRRRKQPLMVILEDLQWAGNDSLELLIRLNREVPR